MSLLHIKSNWYTPFTSKNNKPLEENIMKILVINGSPKVEQSNSMVLTRAFLEGAGWGDAEVISVEKLNFRSCIGCYGCWTKTPGKCVLKDDMNDVLPKLVEADVVVWSFPLYYFSLPGDLKNFIDRQLPLALPDMAPDSETGDHPSRYDLSNQRHIYISTCGFWTDKGNYESIYAMLDRWFGKGEVETIFVGQGGVMQAANMEITDDMPDEVKGMKQILDGFMSTVRQAGKEFAGGGINPETKTALAQPMFPQEVYEKGANESFGV